MPTYNVSKSFASRCTVTEKAASVMRMFGLTVERLSESAVTYKCRLEINDGDIVYITGPSGAGKSVLLRELEKAVPVLERINLDEIELPVEKTLVDCIEGDFLSALKLLSTAGLNDVFCVLNQPANLSDGQKYRFRLAAALASGKRFIFADEFCTSLDRITAAVIAYNIQWYAKRNKLDLAPDVLVVKELSGPAEVVYKSRFDA